MEKLNSIFIGYDSQINYSFNTTAKEFIWQVELRSKLDAFCVIQGLLYHELIPKITPQKAIQLLDELEKIQIPVVFDIIKNSSGEMFTEIEYYDAFMKWHLHLRRMCMPRQRKTIEDLINLELS